MVVTALESSPRACRGGARATASRSSRGRSRPGWKKAAPYDQILIDGAVEYIPDAIVDQLADGGRLGTALVDRGITRLVVGRKAGGAFGYLSLERCRGPGAPRFHAPPGIHFLRGFHAVVRKLLTGSLIAALMAGTASADTLREALVSAYQTNPTLTAQRQTLQATDATVAIAKAAGRPQISGTRRPQPRPQPQRGSSTTAARDRRSSAGVGPQLPFIQRRQRQE